MIIVESVADPGSSQVGMVTKGFGETKDKWWLHMTAPLAAANSRGMNELRTNYERAKENERMGAVHIKMSQHDQQWR